MPRVGPSPPGGRGEGEGEGRCREWGRLPEVGEGRVRGKEDAASGTVSPRWGRGMQPWRAPRLRERWQLMLPCGSSRLLRRRLLNWGFSRPRLVSTQRFIDTE